MDTTASPTRCHPFPAASLGCPGRRRNPFSAEPCAPPDIQRQSAARSTLLPTQARLRNNPTRSCSSATPSAKKLASSSFACSRHAFHAVHNWNREVDDLRLFEMGTVFTGNSERVQEKPSLAIGATGTAITHTPSAACAITVFRLKGIANKCSPGSYQVVLMDAFPPATGLMPPWLHPGRAARLVVDGETLGCFGELAPQESQSRKLRQTIFSLANSIWRASFSTSSRAGCP